MFALDRPARIALALLLLGAALLYLATLQNSLTPGELSGGDLITHHYAQVQARPANAPGYPLYTMGGWLWFHGWRSLWPGANPVAVLSSFSTLWALLALAIFFLLARHLTHGNLAISLGLSAFYAVTYFFWFYSVSAEQYTSASAQTLAILALVHAWEQERRQRYLYALAFLLGLSLAHLVTVLFIAPGILLFLVWGDRGLLRRGRLVARSLALALLPLVSYLFVYVRGAQHPEWRGAGSWPSAGAWFLDFISTRQGRGELTWALGPLTDEFPRLIWVELTPLLLIVGLAGFALSGQRYALIYGLTTAIYLVFSYVDRLGNWFQVIMPLYPLFLLGAAVSFDRLWQISAGRGWRYALAGIMLALVITKAAAVYPRANLRDRDAAGLAPGQAILLTHPPRQAALLTTADEKLALDYLTIIAGRRPDLRIIGAGEVNAVLAAGQALFVSPAAAAYAARETGLPLRYTAWAPGLLAAAAGRLPTLANQAWREMAQPLGDGLSLAGYRLEPGPAPDQLGFNLALRADQPPNHDWAISVRLLANGHELSQQDHPAPALGLTPTSSLAAGEIVHDAFRFDLIPPARPDVLRLILYRPLPDGGFENLNQIDFPADNR
jgi:hypothetical protein